MKERKLMFARALKLIKPHYKVTLTEKYEISKQARHWLNQYTYITCKEMRKHDQHIIEQMKRLMFTGSCEISIGEDGQ